MESRETDLETTGLSPVMETTSSMKHSVEKYVLTFLPFDLESLGQNFKIPITALNASNTAPERLSDCVK